MKLPVRVVVKTDEEDPNATGVATTGDGVLINSGSLDGLNKADAIAGLIEEDKSLPVSHVNLSRLLVDSAAFGI